VVIKKKREEDLVVVEVEVFQIRHVPDLSLIQIQQLLFQKCAVVPRRACM